MTANEITIIYNVENKTRIRIFGKIFVLNNKNKCKIKVYGKIKELSKFLNVKKKNKKNLNSEKKDKLIKKIKLYQKK